MSTRIFVATIALLAVAGWAQANGGTAAAAAPAAASAPVATPTAAADADKQVCKTEKPMGSLIPKRICKTALQWEAEREQARKLMQDAQQRTGTSYGR